MYWRVPCGVQGAVLVCVSICCARDWGPPMLRCPSVASPLASDRRLALVRAAQPGWANHAAGLLRACRSSGITSSQWSGGSEGDTTGEGAVLGARGSSSTTV